MKKPEQTPEVLRNDLRHASRILDRARHNTSRERTRNRKLVAALSEVVMLLTEDTVETRRSA